MIDHATGGGAERFATEQAIVLQRRGHEVSMIISRVMRGDDERRVAELHDAGVDVDLMGRTSTRDVLAWFSLARRIRAQRLDVLISHKHGSNVWAALIARFTRTPLVATEHTWEFEGDRMRLLLDRFLVGRTAKAMVAVSERDAQLLTERVGIPAAKVHCLPPALTRSISLRASKVPNPARFVVGTVCSIRPQKALHVLVEGFSIARGSATDWELHIVGDGPDLDRVRDAADKHQLGHALVLHGRVTDPAPLLANFDIFAISSDFEGTPLALFEAMSAGVPVVATNVGGIPRVLEEDCGLLVDPADPAQLGQALRALANDPDRRAEMSEAARSRVVDRYTMDAAMSNWEALLEQLLRSTRSAAP